MSGWTKVDADVALEVLHHEAIIRQAYKDSVGKWTWSAGLTSATGHNVERYINNPQTLEHCIRIYVWALDRYADDVRKAFHGYPLTKAQFAAALSFHWNTGKIKKASWVGLAKKGRMKEAEVAFMLYKKPPEIIPRRRLEAALFFHGDWSNDGTTTEYTRLNKNHTPVWKSAKKIDVRDALQKAFGKPAVKLDHAADPNAPVEVPTLSPEGIDPLKPEGYNPVPWYARLWAWIKGVFANG